MGRLAAVLRRLADRIDPPQPGAATPPEPARERGPIEKVRERQEERLRELEYLIEYVREHDPDSGLRWFESQQLQIVVDLLELELAQRDHQLKRILGYPR